MKTKILLLLAFFSLGGFIQAQNNQFEGFYQGRKWGLFLLSDKKFLLWNPLAGVKGDYQVQKDGMIWLQPQKEPLFLVYARNDKDLSKDKIRVELVNFQLGKNYIHLERGGYYSVSNEDNDLVHTFAQKEVGKSITFIGESLFEEYNKKFVGIKNAYEVSMNPAYNDYIVFCHSYSLYQGESIAAFTNKDGMEILLLMNEEETLEKNKEALAKIRSNIEKTPLKEIKNYIYIRKKDENEKEMLKTVQSQLGIEDSKTIFREKYEREGTSPYEYMGKITYDKEKNIYKEAERDRTYHKYDLMDTKKSEIDMKKLKIKISPLFPE